MKILEQNGRYSVISQFTIEKELPKGTYELDWDSHGNCFLVSVKDLYLSIDQPLYDVSMAFRNRLFKSYKQSQKNMGILLTGRKGSGKSVDAKLICVESNLPVILITKRVPSTVNFTSFLNSIEQEYVLFIDEFEKRFKKVYEEDTTDYHTDEVFLSFMDGLNSKYKKMFLLTSNGAVSEYLMNRPSRIRYKKEYNAMSEELINRVIDDMIVRSEYKSDLLQNIERNTCTIDILKSIITEMNILDEPYSAFKDDFNYRPETNRYAIYFKKEGQNDSEYVKSAAEYDDYSGDITNGNFFVNIPEIDENSPRYVKKLQFSSLNNVNGFETVIRDEGDCYRVFLVLQKIRDTYSLGVPSSLVI